MKEDIAFAVSNFTAGFATWNIVNDYISPNYSLIVGIIASVVGGVIFYDKKAKRYVSTFKMVFRFVQCFAVFFVMMLFGLMMSQATIPIVYKLYFIDTKITIKEISPFITGIMCMVIQGLRMYGTSLMDVAISRLSKKRT